MMRKASGSVTLYLENVEFEDDRDLCLLDQAIEALRLESGKWFEVEDVRVEEIDGTALRSQASTLEGDDRDDK
jgi:hypothetical protein